MSVRQRDSYAPPASRVGQTLNGKWRIDRLIEVGGMGAVFEATHRNGRRVAIKLLHGKYAKDPEVRRRFLREGYVANKIDHPGAVAILDDDTGEDGSPFLVMELLDGESLSAWIGRVGGKLPLAEVLAVSGQVLDVLALAHANGIVHRDIKPANVFVTKQGHAKLLDFGLARVRDGALSLIPTAVGIVMGTPGYMAPEQARGLPDQIDARADIFAVGAVMFRALSGRRIHEKATTYDMTVAAMGEKAPPLGSLLPNAGPALAQAVDRALAFDKAQRWQSAREMFEALRVAYDESRGLLATAPTVEAEGPASIDLPITFEAGNAPSLVVDVAFGAHHEDAIAQERRRTRDVAEGMGSATGEVSIAVDFGGPGES